MSGGRYYSNLPGVQTLLEDGNLYSRSIPRSDLIVVLGTAKNGPKFTPEYLQRPNSAALTYGEVTSEATCNILKGIHQVSRAGGQNIVGCRITGQFAETILLESATPTSVSLANLDDGATTPGDLGADNTQKIFPLVNASGTQIKWLSTVIINTGTTTATLTGTDGVGDVNITAAEWVEGQDYWINYKDGYIEFAVPPISGIVTFSSAGYWPYSIRLQSVWPGDMYNTSYTTSTETATMLVTVNATERELTITRPGGMGNGDIEISWDNGATNAEIASAINLYVNNSYVLAYVDGTNDAVSAIVSNNTSVHSNTDETTGIWSPTFFTWTNAGYWKVTVGLEDTDMDYWADKETYRRFHYGDNEEYNLVNLPGVTGIPAPYLGNSETVGADLSRPTAVGYLKYYWATHASRNFKQDLYNNLLYYGENYVECWPDEDGIYYDDDNAATNIQDDLGTKSVYGAFDYLEAIEAAWLVPKNLWADDVVYMYQDNESGDDAELTSFATLFSEFAGAAWERGSHTMVSMSYRPIISPSMTGVRTHVSNAIAHASGIDFATISGITGAYTDAGRLMVISAGPEMLVNLPGIGSAYTTPEALVAGTISILSPDQSPLNQPLYGALQMKYTIPKSLLNDLVGAHLTCFHTSFNDGRIKFVDGRTMASDISGYQASDYTSIRTMRIVVTAVNVIKQAAEPWLGKGNSIMARQSLETEIDTNLMRMVESGVLKSYSFNISSSNTGWLSDTLEIALTLRPTDEIRHIQTTVSVRR